jgi:hypothetical protein
MKKISAKTPVMKARCNTCPFNQPNSALANEVQTRVVSSGSQLCHHPRLSGKKETHLCRGARDFQLKLVHRLGIITEPTDEAWSNKATELGLV